tara:strand:+ start:279 stop:677 length:399 start_codon:yes stop_codon:yes gene_type:complete
MSFFRFISNKITLATVTFLSGLISAYDNVMNVVFYHTLPMDERNPVASKIIEYSGVSGLVMLKSLGTLAAVAIMLLLIKTKYKYVLYPVFFVQLLLFYYLTFYSNDYKLIFDKDFWVPLEMFVEFYKGEHRP